jgi:hypothetical protein
MFIDDFIRDPELRSADWGVSDPSTASMLTNLPGGPFLVAAPSMRFSSQHGLSLAAPAGGSQAGIETRYGYTPPFRITAQGTAASVGPGVLEIGVATADGRVGVGVVAGAGPATAAGFRVVAGSIESKSWRAVPDPLAQEAPTAGTPYDFIIDVDSGGLAHLYLQSSGRMLGAAQTSVGMGPFYVIVGQASGSDPSSQPNQAYWKGVTVRRPAP